MRLSLLATLACLAVSGCNGVDLGDNPSPDVRKESGPLTVPPTLSQPTRR